MDVENIDDADTQLEFLDLRSNKVFYGVFQQNSSLEFYSRLEEEKYPVLFEMQKSGFVNSQARTVVNKHSQS